MNSNDDAGGTVEGLIQLALRLEQSGDLAKAGEMLEQARALAPSNADVALAQGRVLSDLSDVAGAIRSYADFLAAHGDNAEVLYQISYSLALAARFDEADEYLQRGAKLRTDDAQFCTLYGAVALARGQHEQAVTMYRRAIELGNDDEHVVNDLGVALQELEHYAEAMQAYQAVLEKQPDFTPALINMAKCLTVEAKLREAHRYLQRAVDISPTTPTYLRSLGLSFNSLGRYDEAVAWLQKATEIEPGFAEGQNSLAIALANAGRLEDSLMAHRRTLELQPTLLSSYHNLAIAHVSLEQFDEALKLAAQATEMAPESIEAKLSNAFVMEQSGACEKALAEVERALALDPGHSEALFIKCALLRETGRHEELLQTLLQSLQAEPDSIPIASEIVDAVLTLCDWNDVQSITSILVNLIEKKISQGLPIGVCINNLQSLPLSYEFIANAAIATAKVDFEEMAAVRQACDFRFPNPNRGDRPASRIRIGYLIPYVHFHSLPIILKEIVERHDRDKFEIFGYCPSLAGNSDFSREYIQAFDAMVFGNGSDRVVAEKIYQDGIDILVDIAGYTLKNCMAVNAMRPAPVIAHFLGYSITTGADFIDYLITDEIYLPREDAELGPEAMVYLPDCFLATKQFDISANGYMRADQGLPDEAVVFCNFNQPFKFEPEIFATWMRILVQVPESVMWFGDWAADTRKYLKSQASALNVDPERLIFSKLIDHADHLERLGLADLTLDCFHHGGGVTTVDCLWAGVPVLTCAGQTPPSRLGKSILTTAGLSELVVDDLAAYENKAVELGRDRAALSALKDNWRERRTSSPLFDNDRYMTNLEAAYELIWTNHLSGTGPVNIRVPAQAPKGGVRDGQTANA